MSYTVEVPATVMGPEFDPVHPGGDTVYVTTFFGSSAKGRMVQISTGCATFACLTIKQLDELVDVLRHAQERSLSNYGKEIR